MKRGPKPGTYSKTPIGHCLVVGCAGRALYACRVSRLGAGYCSTHRAYAANPPSVSDKQTLRLERYLEWRDDQRA